MKPHILFLDQQSWRAGGQRVLEMVLEALQDDFEPIVGLPGDGPFADDLRSRNVETFFYPLGLYRPGQKSVAEMFEFTARSAWSAWVLARLIARREVRLVYINGPRCLVAGVLAARLSRIPAVFHLHRSLCGRADLFVAAHAVRHVEKVIACSEAAAASLIRAKPRLARITQVVYNPAPVPADLPPSAHRIARAESGPVLGTVGRLTPQKGQIVLLRALARLRNRWPRFRAIVLGAPDPATPEDAAYVQELVAEAARLGLEGNIHWAGYQTQPELYYPQFDVMVIPTLDEGEGLPMVALEALRAGLPIVASRVGGLPEVVREGVNGMLVPPGDDKTLAAALEGLLSDAARRTRLAAGARASLDHRFSPQEFFRSIRSLVGGVLEPAQVPSESGKAEAAV